MEPQQISSRKNPLMTHIRKLVSSRKYRRAQGEFLGDGRKLLEEALRWNAPLTTVVATEGQALPVLPEAVRLVHVPEDVMASISPMESPQGVLFLCKIPETAPCSGGSRYLVLDGLQDPGNVGTIWRSADALGADGVILTGSCADPWNHKTVRATMGACFRLPIFELEYTALSEELAAQEIPLYAAALGEGMTDLRHANLTRCAVAIGSEGEGVSDSILALCEKRIVIPMRDRCESLNAAAAAAVVLWEMARDTLA